MPQSQRWAILEVPQSHGWGSASQGETQPLVMGLLPAGCTQVVASAYPYVMARLLEDRSPTMRAVLRDILMFSNGAVRWNRVRRMVSGGAAEPLGGCRAMLEAVVGLQGPCACIAHSGPVSCALGLYAPSACSHEKWQKRAGQFHQGRRSY